MEISSVEAGRALGMSDQAIRDQVDAGRLRARRHGMRRLLRIRVDDLRAFARQYNYVVDEEYLATLAEQAN